ncbi:MAG: hypothetical protein N2442_12050 [Spirochaetes bacterium]|nr:hypothetical protein [Spirochaetota bacterium]
MNKNFPHDSSLLDSLLSLLEVLDEPFFHWIFHPGRKRTREQRLLPTIRTPWELIQHLSTLLDAGMPFLEPEYEEILPLVWVAKSVRIHGTASLLGPIVIGEGVEIGQEVYLQGPSYLGKGTRVERGADIRSSILCEGVRIGSFSTVLDSILGKEVILEDRVTTLTRGNDPIPLCVEYPPGVSHPTGCHRLGSFLCPGVRVHRGVHLKPGTFIPKGSLV